MLIVVVARSTLLLCYFTGARVLIAVTMQCLVRIQLPSLLAHSQRSKICNPQSQYNRCLTFQRAANNGGSGTSASGRTNRLRRVRNEKIGTEVGGAVEGGAGTGKSINGPVAADTLVFTCDRRNLFSIMRATSLSQGAFWAVLATIAPTIRDTDPEATEDSKPGMGLLAIRYGFCALSVALSAAFLTFGFLIPRQFVRTLTVLKGGNIVRVGTYGMFGRRAIEVPRSKCQFGKDQLAHFVNGEIATFRIAGERFRFILDGQKGVFQNPRVFNWLVKTTS
eukprot:m.248851 g.248851  ORF g.248851 m.248851 type:complete len:279 (+) comp19509_c0_seq2:110-946(+)